MVNRARGLFRTLYHAAEALGRPVGGLRPRRMYDFLGRRAFGQPEYRWFRNRWGHELYLSPHYHIDRSILSFGTYDRDLHEMFERLLEPGMVTFDVGANLGEMALHMASRVGRTGAVYAFEPVPAVSERLRQNVNRNGLEEIVRIVAFALSDADGETEIAYADTSSNNQGLASIVNFTEPVGSLRATIKTITLDHFVREEDIDRIDFIKIDIQGAEARFLDGARETLSRFHPKLFMEFSPADLSEAGLTSRDLARRIESHDYDIRLVGRNGVGPPILIANLSESFAAPNVLCSYRGRR